jgi:predicted alpha/beta-fold hydrolase
VRAFDPFFKNPHLATIAGNFWKRPISEARWPVEAKLYPTEPNVKVLVHRQQPTGTSKGEIILVHGLEGSSESGYARSMAYAALERGYAVNRFNMRGCGGTEELSVLSYHAGQTSDLLAVAKERRNTTGAPIFIVGYSLGANVALKLAGELGDDAEGLIAGICSVSAPIDLAACADALNRPQNFIYQNRFLVRLKDRIRRKNRLSPDVYTLEHLPKVKSIVDFDDHYTARLFGFGTAANYFRTQSSNQFLENIRVPTLITVAKDDPLIPHHVYGHPALRSNAHIQYAPVEHGGHLGFISRSHPRFWLDDTLLDWIGQSSKK